MALSASVEAVLFDLDDTLYEEMTFVRSGFGAVARHVSERFGIDSDELVAEMVSVLSAEGRGEVFDRTLGRYGLHSKDLVEEMVSVYHSHQPRIRLYSDVLPAFQELKKCGVKLGIITDGLHTVQKKKLDSLGLPEMVDLIICTNERGRKYWKPHPDAFERAAWAFKVHPGDAVYVGNDTSKDFDGPNSIGMASVHLWRDRNGALSCDKECAALVHISELSELCESVSGAAVRQSFV